MKLWILLVLLLFVFGCAKQGVVFEGFEIDEISSVEGDHVASFVLVNQAKVPAKCVIYLNLSGNFSSHDMGMIEGKGRKDNNITFLMPEGDTLLEFTQNCSFSSN